MAPVWALAAGCIGAIALAGELPGFRIPAAALGIAFCFAAGCRRWRCAASLVWLTGGMLCGLLAWQGWELRTPYFSREAEYTPIRLHAAEIRITDPACAPSIPWLPQPRTLRAELIGGDGLPSGEIRFTNPDDFPAVGRRRYGDRVRVTGTLYPSQHRFLPGRLQAERIDGEVVADPGLQGELLQVRDRLLARLGSGMPEDSAQLLAALFFGCRQGLERAERQNFVLAGVVHLFSVSGLHIGIFGALLLAALFWCPFRVRYWAGLATVIYVAMTGYQTPAVRAFLMFGIWCVARAMLAKTPPLRLVALAAVAILLWSPDQLWSMGFQFSFLVTGLLVAGVERERDWRRALETDSLWRPPAVNRRWRLRIPANLRRKVLGAVFCAGVAYLGGSALTLYYQGIFAPVSMLANLLLIPLVTLLYPLGALKLALADVSFAAAGLNRGLDGLAAMLRTGVECAAALVGNAAPAQPTVWELGIFFAGLFLVLLGRRKRRWCGWIAVIGCWIFWYALPAFAPAEMLVIEGRCLARPGVLVCVPATGEARFVGLADYDGAELLADAVARNGIRRIETVVLTGNRTEDWRTVENLARRFEIGTVVQAAPEDARSNPTRAETAGRVAFAGFRNADAPGVVGNLRVGAAEKSRYLIFFRLHRAELELHCTDDTRLYARLNGEDRGGEVADLPILRRSRPELRRYRLEN